MTQKPRLDDPSSWPHIKDGYGISPAAGILPVVKSFNDLQPEQRKYVSKRFVQEMIDSGQWES